MLTRKTEPLDPGRQNQSGTWHTNYFNQLMNDLCKRSLFSRILAIFWAVKMSDRSFSELNHLKKITAFLEHVKWVRLSFGVDWWKTPML